MLQWKNAACFCCMNVALHGRVIMKYQLSIKLDALTRKCKRCSSVCSSWWEGVGLRPGGGVTRSPDSSSSPGVFSHLDGASSNTTHGVSPPTWQGQEESLNHLTFTEVFLNSHFPRCCTKTILFLSGKHDQIRRREQMYDCYTVQ